MNILVKCTFVAFCFYPCTGIASDYYWRNYFGVIPYNLVKGENDDAGNVRYVGQVLVYQKSMPRTILPAIYSGQKRAVATEQGNNIHIDYYWRNYFGVIPDDAIKGGYDETGNVTYIGQILVYQNSTPPAILPAIIYPGQKRAVATNYGYNIYNEEYVKILCSPRKDLMQWRQTTLDEMHLLTDYHIVIGGWDADGDMVAYIGRANVDHQLMTGKVYPKSSEWAGLTLNTKARRGLKLSSFELLVYSWT